MVRGSDGKDGKHTGSFVFHKIAKAINRDSKNADFAEDTDQSFPIEKPEVPNWNFKIDKMRKKFRIDILKCQIGTSSWGGVRKLPFSFTEQGVAMLAGVLNSDRAIMVNIQIMRVFTEMRKMLMDNTELRLAIEEIKKKTENNVKNIEVVFQHLDELIEKKESKKKPNDSKPLGYRIKRHS